MDMVRCMLKSKDLPKMFWGEAVAYAIYLLNRCPLRSLQNMTPLKAWYKRKPNVEHLGVFGCLAYAHIPNHLRRKLDANGEKCIFVG